MGKFTIKIALAAALLASGATFADGEYDDRRELLRKQGAMSGLNLEPMRGKGGYQISYVSDKQTVGLQFDLHGVKVSEGAFTCGEQFSREFVVDCTAHDGFVRVLVFSPTLELVPSGILMGLSSESRQDANARVSAAFSRPRFENVVFSDVKGQDVTPDRHRSNQ